METTQHVHSPSRGSQLRLTGETPDRGFCGCGSEIRLIKGEWVEVGATMTPGQITEALRRS